MTKPIYRWGGLHIQMGPVFESATTHLQMGKPSIYRWGPEFNQPISRWEGAPYTDGARINNPFTDGNYPPNGAGLPLRGAAQAAGPNSSPAARTSPPRGRRRPRAESLGAAAQAPHQRCWVARTAARPDLDLRSQSCALGWQIPTGIGQPIQPGSRRRVLGQYCIVPWVDHFPKEMVSP